MKELVLDMDGLSLNNQNNRKIHNEDLTNFNKLKSLSTSFISHNIKI